MKIEMQVRTDGLYGLTLTAETDDEVRLLAVMDGAEFNTSGDKAFIISRPMALKSEPTPEVPG